MHDNVPSNTNDKEPTIYLRTFDCQQVLRESNGNIQQPKSKGLVVNTSHFTNFSSVFFLNYIMQPYQLFAGLALFVVFLSKLVRGAEHFEVPVSDFANEHTLSTLLYGIDQGLYNFTRIAMSKHNFTHMHTSCCLLLAFTSDSFQPAPIQPSPSSEKAWHTIQSESGSIALIIRGKSTAGIVVNKCASLFQYSFKVHITTGSGPFVWIRVKCLK